MAIVRMISRDPAEFRAFQTRMTEVGRIRLGIYATPEGKRGRPEKIDCFRLTAPDEQLIRAAAGLYGGEATEWKPQGGGAPQWEVITEAKALDVWVINGPKIDPCYEAWGGGRTCLRRCDGEWDSVQQQPCVCNNPDTRPADKDLCKITTRAWVMLPRIQGVHAWRLESHGENFAAEVAKIAPFVAVAPMMVPAMLRLREEERRVRNHEKRTFETKRFYVPWLDVSELTAQQVAGGNDAMVRALTAAGAPAALSGTVQQAIEASAPVSAVPAPAAPVGISDELRGKIVADIESRDTLEGLMEVRAKLVDRGVDDQTVKDSWNSRKAAIEYRARMRAETVTEPAPADDMPRVLPFPSEVEMAAVGTGCCGGYRTPDGMWSPCTPCPIMTLRSRMSLHPDRAAFPGELDLYDRAVARGATHEAILHTGGPAHWLATDDQAGHEAAEMLGGEPVEGTVEGAPDPLPMVPDGDYDADEVYASLMTGASKQVPPLTTAEVNALISRTFGQPVGEVHGYGLARLRAGLKSGAVAWRRDG